MSDGNRGYILVAAIAALFVVGITGAQELRCQRDYYAQGTYQIQADGERQEPPRFDRGWFPCLIESAIAAPKADGANEQEQRDLIAQESMALWTFWMVAFAGATTVITGVGTIFIAKQVRLTREAVKDTGAATEAMREGNQIAHNTMIAENRAWLQPTITKFGDWTQLGDQCQLPIEIQVKNIGKSIATDVLPFATLMPFERGTQFSDLEAAVDKLLKRMEHYPPSFALFPDQPYTSSHKLAVKEETIVKDPGKGIFPNHRGIYILFGVQYRTIFDGEDRVPKRSFFLWRLKQQSQVGGAAVEVAISSRPISGGDLSAFPHSMNIARVT